MLEIDVLSGRHSTLPLVVPDRVDQPAVMLPERFAARKPEIVVAEDLSILPFALDALTQEKRSLYTAVPLDEVPTVLDKIAEQTTDKKGSSSLLSKSGLLIATNLDYGDVEETRRKTSRQIQRTAQFQKLIEITDRWEKNHKPDLPKEIDDQWKKGSGSILDSHRGGVAVADKSGSWEIGQEDTLSIEQEYARRQLLPLFKRIIHSWYKEELRQEPLTNDIARDIILSRVIQPEDTVAEAEEHLRHMNKRLLNLKDVEDEVNLILHPSPEPEKPDGELTKIVQETQTRERKERQQQKPDEVKENAKKMGENGRAAADSYWERQSGVLYVYDSELDEPSSDAAEYVRQLWERPF